MPNSDRRPATDSSDRLLDGFWDDLVTGNDTAPRELDPALAATIRHLHAIDRARRPDPAFLYRLRQGLMLPAVPATTRRDRWLPWPIGHRVPDPARGMADGAQRRRWAVNQVALAALLVVTVAVGNFAFEALRPPSAGGPAGTPAAIASPVATPPATIVPTVLVRALASELPAAVTLTGIHDEVRAPGTSGPLAVEFGPSAVSVISGALTVRADRPMTVVRGPAGTRVETPEVVVEGVESVLEPGDSVFFPYGAHATTRNDGQVPAVWIGGAVERYLDYGSGLSVRTYPYQIVGSLPPAPAMVTFSRASLTPGAGTGPFTGPGWQLAGAEPEDWDDLVARDDGSVENIGTGTVDVYILSVVPAETGTVAPAESAPVSSAMSRGNPARTGEQSGPGPAKAPGFRWVFATGNTAKVAVVADGETVFAAADGLYAIDAVSGQARWTFGADRGDWSAPCVSDGVVYAATADGSLFAVEAITGQQRWVATLGGPSRSSPAVVDTRVYITSGFGNSSPAVVDGVVFIAGGHAADTGGSGHAILHAIDAATGTELWRLAAPEHGIYAVDAETGNQRWFSATAELSGATPAVTGGAVFVGSTDGVLHAFDARSGRERWQVDYGWVTEAPAVWGGLVYVPERPFGGLADMVLGIDAVTGSERWRFGSNGRSRLAIVTADGIGYVASVDGLIYALDLATGEERWNVGLAVSISSPPAVAGEMIYVGVRDADGKGAVYALARDGPASVTPVS